MISYSYDNMAKEIYYTDGSFLNFFSILLYENVSIEFYIYIPDNFTKIIKIQK